MASANKQILIICLANSSVLNDIYQPLCDILRSKSTLSIANTPDTCIQNLSNKPDAVIVFEPSIMNQSTHTRYQSLINNLVAYTKDGGNCIFGCACSSFVTPSNLEQFFSTVWEKPWKCGNYGRFIFKLNSAGSVINNSSVVHDYDARALQLKNVDEEDVIYRQNGGSVGLLGQMAAHGMLNFDPHPDNAGANGGPVIWSKYHDGRLGWLGDVNNEDETVEILLRMCGL